MNKQIKFRAWCPETKRLFNVANLSWENNEITNIEGHTEKEECCTIWGSEPSVLMQFTGLKDKNGREIFEGDIVFVKRDCSTFDESRYEEMKLEVKYYPDRGFGAYWGHEDCNSESLQGVEVIGNVYENPELTE